MLLLDQGLPRSATRYLREAGIPAVHAGEVGLSSASDEAILDYARSQKLIVVTLDADFHRKLVLSDANGAFSHSKVASESKVCEQKNSLSFCWGQLRNAGKIWIEAPWFRSPKLV